MVLVYEVAFNHTLLPFVIEGGDPATDPLIIKAVQNAFQDGLGHYSLVDWFRRHQDYLTSTYTFSAKANALYDHEYVWFVLLGYLLARRFAEDEPDQFAAPYMPFALPSGQKLSNSDLFLLHTTCYTYAISSPLRYEAGGIMSVSYVHELIQHTANKLGEEQQLITQAAPSAVRDVVAGGSIVREATTNRCRWFANIVEMSLRLVTWPGKSEGVG